MTSQSALDTTTGTDPNRSIRNAGLTAGIALLVLAPCSRRQDQQCDSCGEAGVADGPVRIGAGRCVEC